MRFRIPLVFLAVFLALAAALTLAARAALAQQRVALIRDTELEDTIRAYATPVFEVAGLDARAVRIYVVNDSKINAFVAGGQNLFLNAGLLMRSEDAGQVIGVIAHEVGHIEGGHLSRIHQALERGTAESILALVLGAAAAAAGRPDLGAAVMMGGHNIALRNFLQYTRTQEGAADAAAMRYLDGTRQSARPLLRFFELLGGQELLSTANQDPYLRTHPLSRDRITALAEFVERSPWSDAPIPPGFAQAHARMKAKLHAHLDDPHTTLRRYPATDASFEARYARAIALYRQNRFRDALAALDDLIGAAPPDPYLFETKGQMLFESGNPSDAVGAYRQAAALAPEAALIRVDLGRTLLATNDPELVRDAIGHLRFAVLREPNRPFAWRQLAIALGRDDQMGESALALAEEGLLQGKKPETTYQAGKAQRLLPEGSAGWLRAGDILTAIENQRKQEEE